MPEAALIQIVLKLLLTRRCAEFTWNGEAFLIQPDNNKGCDYLSLWRTAPRPARLGEAMYDVMYGIDEDAVSELLQLPCIHGKSVLDCGEIEWV